MRSKNWRKHQSKRIQNKRLKKYKRITDNCTPSQKGKLRKTHVGCGCSMCKPWKHGLGEDMKYSDRKRS